MKIIKSPLSLELKLLCEIYWCNKHDLKCTFQRLVTTFKRYDISHRRIETALNTLFDWSMLHCKSDEHMTLYIISTDTKPTAKELYKRYWKKERSKLCKVKNIK
jgi:hypothetical protein